MVGGTEKWLKRNFKKFSSNFQKSRELSSLSLSWPNKSANCIDTTPGPRTSIKSRFWEILTTFGDKCPQNGSKNGDGIGFGGPGVEKQGEAAREVLGRPPVPLIFPDFP